MNYGFLLYLALHVLKASRDKSADAVFSVIKRILMLNYFDLKASRSATFNKNPAMPNKLNVFRCMLVQLNENKNLLSPCWKL